MNTPRLWLISVTLAVSSLALAQTPLSPRNANYTIEVKLDPQAKTLAGREIITWRNDRDQPTNELWFHLYYNAWKNTRSTWLLERTLTGGPLARGARRDIREEDWGYVNVNSVKILSSPKSEVEAVRSQENFNEIDLASTKRFAAPDDGNAGDQSVMVVTLPHAVAPGDSIQIELAFTSKIPRTFARTGYRGNYFFIAQWFPKLGVYENGGAWNCHQFHAGTEFFSDYGVYDVKITVPSNYVVGATGRLVEKIDNPDGTSTHHHVQADVHDFAWTTSPDYVVREKRFEHAGLPPVEMRLLLQPEHLGQAERHFAATAAALQYYGTWYGAYPYGHITVIDPAYESGSGGMEYPTLFTCGTRWLNPFGGGSPEGVTVHECGHQFWYGIVGNNEFEHAWLDEGFNTFSTARTMEAAFGENSWMRRFFRGFFPVKFEEVKLPRMTYGNRLQGYRPVATSDAQSTLTYHYFPATGARITYDKTALWLGTLERYLGWETLQKIMSTFFERYKFKHPVPDDFFAVVNEVSGRDMTWFFDQAHRSSEVFDYAVQSVSSFPAAPEGFVETGGKLTYAGEEAKATNGANGKSGKIYRTQVIVRRNGGAIFPVEVLVVFANGDSVRENWDGKERWKLFAYEKPARLNYAAVDPERKLILDVDYTNNSKLMKPAAALPARKWASKWMIWLQDLLATFAFFV
jgi:hypothetical protein